MKLKTSFFEPTVLKKDITRFAPLWGLYSLFSLLFLLLLWQTEEDAARLANSIADLFRSMGIINFLYAPLVAFFLFGDLFKSRMCNALHALPMRREGWFFTHLTAGMLFCIVPNGVSALLAAALLQEYAWMAFLWLALMVLQYIFFFGVATFACYCSGNTLGAIAVYGLVNFLAVIVGLLAITFYQPLLYGIHLDFSLFSKYSPVVRFSEGDYLNVYFDNMLNATIMQGFVAADWIYLGITAGIGLVLLGLALVIYRVRQLENAGNLIAFKPAAPVFLVLYTILVGTLLYYVASLAGTVLQYFFLAIGLGVGYFTGKMLLERKAKVFQGKNFLAVGLITVVFFASFGITALDPMGATRYVPETENVKSVTVSASHYTYDIRYYGLQLTEKSDIDTIRAIHQDSIDNRVYTEFAGTEYTALFLRYEMTNGTTLERYYYVPVDSPNHKTLRSYFSTEKAIFNGLSADAVLGSLRMLEVYSDHSGQPILAVATNEDYLDLSYYQEYFSDSCLSYQLEDPRQDDVMVGLFEAIKADCGRGTLAKSGVFYTEQYAHITLRYHTGTGTANIDIHVSMDCENTIEYLKSLQLAKQPTPEG